MWQLGATSHRSWTHFNESINLSPAIKVTFSNTEAKWEKSERVLRKKRRKDRNYWVQPPRRCWRSEIKIHWRKQTLTTLKHIRPLWTDTNLTEADTSSSLRSDISWQTGKNKDKLMDWSDRCGLIQQPASAPLCAGFPAKLWIACPWKPITMRVWNCPVITLSYSLLSHFPFSFSSSPPPSFPTSLKLMCRPNNAKQ